MIRTVWLAIACLIALAGLTVLKVGTASVVRETAAQAEQTAGTNFASDIAVSDVLPKGDRLDAADDDESRKPVRPIAIPTKVASAAPAVTGASEKGWRSSYAKREAGSSRHRHGKLHKASRRHRGSHAARHHAKPKYAMLRKQKKSRSRG